ncbi:hypothetical protein [Cryptosporangium arvum]|uniref:Uncharacterized protein n=1 Tax=Cryptosporangium arvum DSM 44712 TaxID=927661 RepID=A0A010ZKH8_9ACTN|nr:hypothetical protein [Cryptosporangium arvum]EXG79154.1 hypothetical protein CryarDRAFT_0178 [Cryptosporangium arvum DSM 44712]
MSDRMEDLMRRTLQARAEDAGHSSFEVDDLVQRGESARRRRQLGAVGATAVAAVAVILAGALLGRSASDHARPLPPAASQSTAAASPSTAAQSTAAQSTAAASQSTAAGHGAPVDLTAVKGRHLRTMTRDITVPLNLTATSAEVTEVKGGWVSLPRARASRTGTLSFIDPSGTVKTLATDVDAYVVDTTGTRIALTGGDGVTVGTIRDGRLVSRDTARSRYGARPVTFAGNHLVMKVDGSCCGGDDQEYVAPRFAVWDYVNDAFTPRWTTTVVEVHGPVLGGTRLLGIVRQGSVDDRTGCLALLRPEDLSVESRRCDLGLAWGSGYGTLSPSGRYFFDLDAESDGGALFTIAADLDDVRRTDTEIPNQTPIWDDDTAVASVDGGRSLALWRFGEAPRPIPLFSDLQRLAKRPFVRD